MKHLLLILLAFVSVVQADDTADEIQRRLHKWETTQPRYTPGSTQAPARPPASITERYRVDRTGHANDSLAEGFLARGYFILDALQNQRNMAPLTPAEIISFHDALRVTRLSFVDEEQYDNENRRVVAVTIPNPQDPAFKMIRIYRKDWQDSERLGADLVRTVFHEYLRALQKNDDNYIVSVALLTTERDFQKRHTGTSTCTSGKVAPISIHFNISAGFELPSFINETMHPERTAFRVSRTAPICTSTSYRFQLAMGSYAQTVYLYGGDEITVRIPSAEEYYLY